MRCLALLCTVVLALPCLAFDLGTTAPPKPAPGADPPPPSAELIRQGGDTIDDAVPITVPYSGTGTTEGYTDDYNVCCPYISGPAPDVVYSITPDRDMLLTLDMFGSSYDTRLWVWNADTTVIVACNDDYYPDYTSRIDQAPVSAGETYWIVVDGYGDECGEYVLDVTEFEPCELTIPAGAELEGEPPLHDGYVDLHNPGCFAAGEPIFQTIGPLFAGVTGWYETAEGDPARDTDWLRLVNPSGAYTMHVTLTAEWETMLFLVFPLDCQDPQASDLISVWPCTPTTLSFPVVTGQEVWLMVAPMTFEAPWSFEGHEYDYTLEINLPVAVEQRSWSAVKGLFD